MTVGEAAAALGLPGAWTLRRLEARGVLPQARRTLLTNKRYYLVADIRVVRRMLDRRLAIA